LFFFFFFSPSVLLLLLRFPLAAELVTQSARAHDRRSWR
jgi:hypothetical protein